MSRELIAIASCPVHGELARIYAVQAGNEHVKHNVAEPVDFDSKEPNCPKDDCQEKVQVTRV